MIHEDIAFFFVEKKSGRALGRTFDQSVVTEKNKGDLRIRGAVVNNSMAVMSFRRLVHLVVDDVGLRRTYSLRSIDMSRLFRRPPRESTGGCGRRPDQPPPTTAMALAALLLGTERARGGKTVGLVLRTWKT